MSDYIDLAWIIQARRLRLFLGLIGRMNQADYRNGIGLSWKLACIVWC